ncbi:MAG TPA: glycosyltransferase [Rickettsiales bacterium]|nr:glycosyltransferase [Rickettsiales bacterium]
MKILFATAHPFIPQMLGGLQSSSKQMALQLKQRGHEVSFLCALMGEGYIGMRGRVIMKLMRRKAARDMIDGIPIWRAWFPWESADYVLEQTKPDLVIVLARQPVRMAQAVQRAGVPVLMMLQDVEFDDHGGPFEELGNVPCIANSYFTAHRYHNAFGVSPYVVYPFVSPDHYKTQTSRQNVTFINPHPKKGVDIAINIARCCPDIPFTFVEAWPLEPGYKAQLMQQLSAVPNVTLSPSVRDMRQVYSKSKILLAPSRWEEAYGRVASEAQCSGIPVVASNRGGLPEAVGQGGIVLDPDGPIEQWVEGIRRLWHDEKHYAYLSMAAHCHFNRPEMRTEVRMEQLEQILAEAATPTPTAVAA